MTPAERTPLAQAKEKALRLLAARPRTEAQIRERLARDGLAEVAPAVVAWLLQLGYLDDDAYARGRARNLLAPGRLGPRLAERRLVTAGIDPARARQAVAEALRGGEASAGGEPAEARLARDLARRRTGGASPRDLDEKARARLARFLLGRGFSGSTVARVLGVHLDAE